MRASCSGCRALRKGCAEDCTIRPCLAWIRGPDAQANATVFLAKFYGRAGLINLLASAPDDAHRPALFRSLLYEACGRVANPVYGVSGLFSTGQWEACQNAVQAVFDGRRIPVLSGAVRHPGLVAAYDVRHVPMPDPDVVPTPAHAAGPLGVSRAGRAMFKRASSSSTAKPTISSGARRGEHDGDLRRVPSHGESAGSHDHVEDDGVAVAAKQVRGESSGDTEAGAGSHLSQAEHSPTVPQLAQDDDEEIGLELTLGFGPPTRVLRSPPARFDAASSSSAECGHIGLLLELPV